MKTVKGNTISLKKRFEYLARESEYRCVDWASKELLNILNNALRNENLLEILHPSINCLQIKNTEKTPPNSQPSPSVTSTETKLRSLPNRNSSNNLSVGKLIKTINEPPMLAENLYITSTLSNKLKELERYGERLENLGIKNNDNVTVNAGKAAQRWALELTEKISAYHKAEPKDKLSAKKALTESLINAYQSEEMSKHRSYKTLVLSIILLCLSVIGILVQTIRMVVDKISDKLQRNKETTPDNKKNYFDRQRFQLFSTTRQAYVKAIQKQITVDTPTISIK